MRIPYSVTSNVWLSLEHYYNKGLTQDEIKDVIKKLHHLSELFPELSCRVGGVNGNLVIEYLTCSSYVIDLIVDTLSFELNHIIYLKSKES